MHGKGPIAELLSARFRAANSWTLRITGFGLPIGLISHAVLGTRSAQRASDSRQTPSRPVVLQGKRWVWRPRIVAVLG